jgi:hypothetical protein
MKDLLIYMMEDYKKWLLQAVILMKSKVDINIPKINDYDMPQRIDSD